ncbi:MAG: sigma-70 family RNA polymerase sigma factor [Woeseia sp.]
MAGADRTAALFREHQERLTRFARHLVGIGADAEDLVQETFLRAHHYLCNGKEIRAPLSFLFVTMRNLVNDANRQKRIAVVEACLDVDEVAPDDAAPSVERQAMSEREFESLCVAIAQLPERMRYAFVLRKVYGYSCREIAEHLGRSTNTVRDQVAQSFKKLHAFKNCDAPGQREPQSVTLDEREQSEAEESDKLCTFSLAPLAHRESSG